MNKIRTFAFGIAFAAATFTTPSWAQQQQQQQVQDDEDGPGRGVARISLMNGDVSVKRGDTGDLVSATVNSPLMVSDRVLTGPGSRAELQFDSSNLLRMSGVSEVRMSELEWQKYMIQIAAGTVTFRVIRDQSSQIELNTPSVALRPIKKGEYRITVREDGTTEITVRSGELEIFTQKGTERLKSGRTMLARGTSADPEFQIVSAIARDDFDRWNQDRDRYFERSESYGNMSTDIYGGEDLDTNGTWANNPQYGRVWYPRVNTGWAPYQDGRWVYYDYYGWTWVSNDSWGWAPYHYGRWFHDASDGWGWWPGAAGRRQYWRPAFVSFFGWGGNGGFRADIGFGFGNVGWVPLAPYETCYGWWGLNRYNGWRNNGYQNNTTIVNNVNITNIYRNARVNNGITSIGSNDFGRNRIHSGNMIRTRAEDLRGAGVVRGNLPVVPDRNASVRLSDREPRNSGYARTNEDNRSFRTREPARVDRVSFDDQRRGTEDLARRSFDRGGERGNNNATAGGGGTERVRGGGERATERGNSTAAGTGSDRVRGGSDPATGTGNNTGWRRAGEGATSTRGNEGRGATSTDSNGRNSENGWRRFGDTRGESIRGDSSRGNAGTDRVGRGTPESNDNGRGAGVNSNSRGSSGRSSEDGWRRFGDSGRGSSNPSTSTVDGSSGRTGRESRGNMDSRNRDNNGGFRTRERSNPSPSSSWEMFRGGGGSSSRERSNDSSRVERQQQQRSPDPVRISPPIVRDRGGDNGGGGGSFGGGRGDRGGSSSAPARESAPRMERGNSGGGGGSRGGESSGGGSGSSNRGGGGGGGGGGEGGGRGGGGRRGN